MSTPYDASANQSQQLHTTTKRLLLRRLIALLSSPLTSASGTTDCDDLSVSFSRSPPGSGSPDDDEGVSELLSVGIVGTEIEGRVNISRGGVVVSNQIIYQCLLPQKMMSYSDFSHFSHFQLL